MREKVTRMSFKEALLDAYPRPDSLVQILIARLGMNLFAITNRGAYDTDVFHLIWKADAQEWGLKMVNAVRESRPGNDKLLAFSQRFCLASKKTDQLEVERMIDERRCST